jgi:hypothetical protein
VCREVGGLRAGSQLLVEARGNIHSDGGRAECLVHYHKALNELNLAQAPL